jgi:epoxyqueuosine reductase
MATQVALSSINEELAAEGLRLIGFTDFKPLEADKQRLEQWQQKGFFADMSYMNRPSGLLSDPKNLLPEGISIISVAMDYGSPNPHQSCPVGYGKVARYAWGTDYHIVFKEALNRVANKFNKLGQTRAFTDAVPLLERAIANRSSVDGFIGKNTLFIQRKVGSLFFIGEILCGFEIFNDQKQTLEQNLGCKTCTNCQSNCPTGALDSAYTLDSSKCISYLTIEHRKNFNDHQIKQVNDWVFGCDICQQVCPFNFVAIKKKVKPHSDLKNLPIIDNGLISIDSILKISSDIEFKKHFGSSAILRTKRKGLIRNALAVSINQGYLPEVSLIKNLLNDKDLIVSKSASQFVLLSKDIHPSLNTVLNQALDVCKL